MASRKSVLLQRARRVQYLLSYSMFLIPRVALGNSLGIRFLGDFKADNPNLAIKELGREGGVAWRQLPQARKDVRATCIDSRKYSLT